MTEARSAEERREMLDEVAATIRACDQCPLHSARTQAVPGAGRPDADIMFIGEAPGYHEDQQGLPFVGASGKYLGDLLGQIGLTRNDVFITNVVKCRPPGNRDPLPAEMAVATPPISLTFTGESLSFWVPSPSWPAPLSPQHLMSPLSSRAQV